MEPTPPAPRPQKSGAAKPDTAAVARDEQVRAIIQSLRVIYGTVQAHSHWIEQQCGVSATQLWAMRELADAPGLKVTELALALAAHPSNCSNMLDKLRKKGLIRKQRIGPDQRVVRLYLTDEGTALLATAPQPVQGALIDALQRLPESVLAELARTLEGLLGAMKVKEPAASMKPLTGI